MIFFEESLSITDTVLWDTKHANGLKTIDKMSKLLNTFLLVFVQKLGEMFAFNLNLANF